MKRTISVLLSILLVLAFSGCKKEKSLKELLIGKWEIKSLKMITYENNVKTAELTLPYDPNEEVIEIFSDGTGKHYSSGVMDQEFTWTLNDKMLTVNSGTETRELEVSVGGDTLTYKITETEVIDSVTHKTELIYTAQRIS